MKFKPKSTVFNKLVLILSILTTINIFFVLLLIFENQVELISETSVLNSRITAFQTKDFLEKELPLDKQEEGLVKILKAYSIKKIDIINNLGKTKLTIPKNEAPFKITTQTRVIINKALFKSEFEDKIYHQKLNIDKREIIIFIPFLALKENHIARLEISLNQFDKKFDLLIKQATIGSILLFITFIILLIFTNNIIIKPIKSLSKATGQLANGDLDAQVKLVRKDEIGNLATDFNEMAMALRKLTNKAKNSNPLSGLPGNHEIMEEIERHLKLQDKFAILYCDLDNFKAYNDKYGFHRGDDVILYSKEIFVNTVKALNIDDTFVGHEGGDDFVIVTKAEHYQDLAKEIIEKYDSNVEQFYSKTDQKKGFIESVNREGQYRRFRFVSVSIGIVTNESVDFSTYPEIITVAAAMKKHAKSVQGSNYAVNRRVN